jgi:hypothetical protein
MGSGLSSNGQKVKARSHVLKPPLLAGAAAAAVAARNIAASASPEPTTKIMSYFSPTFYFRILVISMFTITRINRFKMLCFLKTKPN